jgi:PKD repeat protein
MMLLFSMHIITGINFKNALPTNTWFLAETEEHELVVNWTYAPKNLNLGESVQVNASVSNMGLKNETDVELFLLINSSVVASKIFPELLVNSTGVVGYKWTPSVEGTYNVTAFSPSVINETITANNFVTKIVQVSHVTVYIDPENVTASVGGNFTINVKIANVTRLYGLDIQLRWSPLNLRCIGHKVKMPRGSKYPDGILYGSIITINDVVNESGVAGAEPGTLYRLTVASFGVPPPPTFNGSGTVFNMTFTVLQQGECDIYFTSTDLSDNLAKPIPHEVKDGYFYMPGLELVPFANFTFWPSKRILNEDCVIVNKTITFNATLSYDPDGDNITRYFWDFGDGTPKQNSTYPLIDHVFTKLGEYERDLTHYVSLMVIDSENSSSKLFYHSVVVKHPRPVANFTIWPPEKVPVVNKTVTFDASISYDPNADGEIIKYMWDFGDGIKINTTEPVINHTYTQVTGDSSLMVRLWVLDIENLTSRVDTPASVSLNVIASRDVAVTNVVVYPVAVKPGFNVTIDATVASTITGGPRPPQGVFNESFDVIAYCVNLTATEWTEIVRKHVDLMRNSSKSLSLYWNTTGVPETSYWIWVEASEVPHETNITNNVRQSSEYVNITAGEVHNVGVTEMSIVASADSRTFEPPVILGENATVRAKVMAKGNVQESFNVTLQIIASNGTVLQTKSWLNETLQSGETKEFAHKFSTKDWTAGNYVARVNATIIEEDEYPNDNSMEKTFRIIRPPILVVAQLPSPIIVGATVTFNASASYYPDGTITTYNWTFSNPSGNLKGSPSGNVVNFTFPEKPESVGDWTVQLVVVDNYTITYNATRLPGTSSYRKVLKVSVENPFPIANFTYLPILPRIGENVTFDASSSSPDGGSISWYYWDFGDGTPKQNGTNTVVVHAYASAGNFTVTLKVGDNLGRSGTKTKSITVLRLTSSMTLRLSKTTIQYGEAILINGTVTPHREGINVTIRANGTVLINVLTDALGNFTYSWTPGQAGTYQINATWPGDVQTEPATAGANLTVNKAISTITLDVSPETVKVGESVTINGTLSPRLIGANVNVTIRVNGTTLVTVLTDDLGKFAYTWRPDEAGIYLVDATWPGDANSSPYTTTTHTVTVEVQPFDIILYVAIAVIAIIIVLVVIYFMKFRKKT